MNFIITIVFQYLVLFCYLFVSSECNICLEKWVQNFSKFKPHFHS